MTLFYSMKRAEFDNVRELMKVISISGTLHELQDKAVFNALVIRKLLHKSYLPSASELQSSSEVSYTTHLETSEIIGSTSSNNNNNVNNYKLEEKLCQHTFDETQNIVPFVIVNISEPTVLWKTLSQVNAYGLYKVNTEVKLTLSRIVHGMCVGVVTNTTTPFHGYIHVCISLQAMLLKNGAPCSNTNSEEILNNTTFSNSLKPKHESGEKTSEQQFQLCLTVRCSDEEPVVTGQSVWLISEPGAGIYCLAIRPPRSFPGEFVLTTQYTTEDTANKYKNVGFKRKRNDSVGGIDGTISEICETSKMNDSNHRKTKKAAKAEMQKIF